MLQLLLILWRPMIWQPVHACKKEKLVHFSFLTCSYNDLTSGSNLHKMLAPADKCCTEPVTAFHAACRKQLGG